MLLRSLRSYKPQRNSDATNSSTNRLFSSGISANSHPRAPQTEVQTPARGKKRWRRKPEHVIQNACLNCKRRRAKCDGKKPCQKCIEKSCDQECSYQPHIKHVKTELVESLVSHDSWKRNAERIFHAIEANENISTIIERLRNHESIKSIAEQLQEIDGDFEGPLSNHSFLSTVEVSHHKRDDRSSSILRWSLVTANEDIVQHLFTLYFTWVHPFHMLFDEQLFVHSYQQRSEAFCSPSLVNAICAMACCYHTAVDADTTDFELLGRGFSEAVRYELDAKDESLLSAQVFAIMFLVGCTQGKGLHASKYLTVANNLMAGLEDVGDNVYQRVWRCTARGINCLNVEWAQMTFQVPLIINTNPPDNSNLDDKEYPTHFDDISRELYRIPKDNIIKMDWHSANATTVSREKAKLLKIVRDAEFLLYNPNGPPISARDMLIVYSRLLVWRRDLSKIFSDAINEKVQLRPHTLSILILYHTAIVQLLRPLLDLEGFPISLVSQVVWRHARHGLFLLDKHCHLLGFCQYLSVTQMYSVLYLTDIIARFFSNVSSNYEKDGPAAIQFAIKVLAKYQSSFPVAGIFIDLIYETAKDVISPLPNDLEELFRRLHSGRSKFLFDNTIDAYTRATYTQPVHNIHMKFSLTISSDWATICTAFGFEEPSLKHRVSVLTGC